jgi:phosphoribosylanthranilate isomerase
MIWRFLVNLSIPFFLMSNQMFPFNRIRVKFCGMTSQEDIAEAVRLGVDAIGLIFHMPSPRHVTLEQAVQITACLPPFISCIGVFVNEEADFVQAVLKEVPLNILQFHGQEPADYCSSFGRPYIKTIHVKPEPPSLPLEALYPNASAFLFDTPIKGLPGGSGVTFNWKHIPYVPNKPFILAGGLNCENIIEALNKVKPYAVDVTSGIEKTKGKKDFIRMKDFIDKCRGWAGGELNTGMGMMGTGQCPSDS